MHEFEAGGQRVDQSQGDLHRPAVWTLAAGCWYLAAFAAQGSAFLKDALGPDMHRTFTAIKAAEYARVARTVSEVDFDLYLHTV